MYRIIKQHMFTNLFFFCPKDNPNLVLYGTVYMVKAAKKAALKSLFMTDPTKESVSVRLVDGRTSCPFKSGGKEGSQAGRKEGRRGDARYEGKKAS